MLNKSVFTKQVVCIAIAAMAVATLVPNSAMAQVKKSQKALPPPPPPLPVIDKMPQFPGGQEKFYDYLKKNLRYPDEAKKKNISGKVFVSFFVEDDGNINELKVVKGIGAGCDVEALRVMRDSPKWQPSIKNGKPVRAKLTVPIAFVLPNKITAQVTPAGKPMNNEVYTAVEESAEYGAGGIDGFYKYLVKHIKYPAAARSANVQGKVYLTFVVELDGSLSDIKVLRGIGSGCDEEAVRLLKNSPKWKPGKQNGQSVRQQYTVPVSFSLS